MKTIMRWAGGAALGLMMSVVYGVKTCTWEKVMKVADHKVLYSDCYLQYIAMKNGVTDKKVETAYQILSKQVYNAVIKISGYEDWSCYKSTEFNNYDFPQGQLIGNCSKKIMSDCSKVKKKTGSPCLDIYNAIPKLGEYNAKAYLRGYTNCITACILINSNCSACGTAIDAAKTASKISNPLPKSKD